jgi:hypothetical protein
MRVDYPFVYYHSWRDKDTLVFLAGPDRFAIYNNTSSVTTVAGVFAGSGNLSIAHSLAGRELTFIIRQGVNTKLARIGLYNVSGQTLAMLDIGNRKVVTAPRIASSGIVYARYLFSDGSSSCQCIPILR